MERFLCLDVGDKRIGVAVSDPFNSYALPLFAYERKNLKVDLDFFRALAKEKAATAIVCGLPVHFDGTHSVQTEKTRFFMDKLKEATGIRVIAADERCTSFEAEEKLKSQGKSRAEIKTAVDALSAAEILESFLNENNNRRIKMEKEKHVHDEHCDCGCQHEHCDCCDDEIVELTTDDGKKLKFFFVGTIEYKGNNYSAFEPAEEIEGLDEEDLVIFRLDGDDEETAELVPIEDDALLDEVFQEFCRVLEEDELAEEAESLEPEEK